MRVPAENVLGEPGEGFRIAMQILNNGRPPPRPRFGGTTKGGPRPGVQDRAGGARFSPPLADFGVVQDKIAWMVSYLFGLESMAYLTCGMVDNGVPDYSLESAICKVSGTEFLWYVAAPATCATPKHPSLLPIFPFFEGANDVLRAFVPLTGGSGGGWELSCLWVWWASPPLPLFWGGRGLRQRSRSSRSADGQRLSDQVMRLRDVTEGLLRRHGKGIIERQFQQKRLSDAVSDIFAQVALLSRVTAILEDQGAEVSGQEIYIAGTFCTRAAGRVHRAFDQIEDNDDERMIAIAKLALKRGSYGYALFED